MRKNRMKKILVMCVIINILFCAEVESVLAYPAQCSISVTRREQQETNWCWAAVSQMIGAHYYGLLTQRQIVINVLGVTTRNSLSYEKIQKYISTSKLMGIKMVWNSGGAHALVLSGYSADGKVTLVDPAANAGIERYSYSSLVAGTTIQSGSGRYTKTWTLD